MFECLLNKESKKRIGLTATFYLVLFLVLLKNAFLDFESGSSEQFNAFIMLFVTFQVKGCLNTENSFHSCFYRYQAKHFLASPKTKEFACLKQ